MIKSFIRKYNWEGTNYLFEIDDWKKDWEKWLRKMIEKNNATIALNVFYTKTEKIYPAYISKHKSNRENKFFF